MVNADAAASEQEAEATQPQVVYRYAIGRVGVRAWHTRKLLSRAPE